MRRRWKWWARLLAVPAAGLLLVAGCSRGGNGSGGTATKGRIPALPGAAQAPEGTATTRPLLGVVYDAPGAGGLPVLARLDPRTLRPLPGPRLRLDDQPTLVAVAPDASAAVFCGDTGQIAVVDLTRMRLVGTVTAPASGWSPGAGWSGPSRVLLAWVSNSPSQPAPSIDLLALGVDNGRLRVLHDRRLDGDVLAAARLGHGLLLLVAPANAIGPAQLLAVDENAGVRTVALGMIIAGRQTLDSGDSSSAPTLRQAIPGLAVDPVGNRAYVVAADTPGAEVDLGSLTVRYHPLSQPTSPLRRLARWLLPAAEAKELSGPNRSALWLGDGLLAVTGSDATVLGSNQLKQEPAGLELIDTRTWTAYPIDPHADSAVLAGGRLLASGTASGPDTSQGYGLTVYGPGDRRPAHLLGSQQVTWLQAAGDLAYVALAAADSATRYAVLDVRAGRVLRQDDGDLPQLLIPGPS